MEAIPTTRSRFPTEARVYGYADAVRLKLGDGLFMFSHEDAIRLADQLVDSAEPYTVKKEAGCV